MIVIGPNANILQSLCSYRHVHKIILPLIPVKLPNKVIRKVVWKKDPPHVAWDTGIVLLPNLGPEAFNGVIFGQVGDYNYLPVNLTILHPFISGMPDHLENHKKAFWFLSRNLHN